MVQLINFRPWLHKLKHLENKYLLEINGQPTQVKKNAAKYVFPASSTALQIKSTIINAIRKRGVRPGNSNTPRFKCKLYMVKTHNESGFIAFKETARETITQCLLSSGQ